MAIAKWMPFAAAQPTAETTKSNPVVPIVASADAKKFGLENFGNTCYANSVLQALYFCTPFRELILQSAGPTVQQPSVVQPIPPSAAVPGRRKPERKYSSAGQSIDAFHANGALQPHTIPIPPSPATLFSALRSLFLHISTNPTDTGTVAPRAFIDKLKEVNELFRSNLHQDAHEFLNYLLNKIVEEIEEERKRQQDGTFVGDDLSSSIATLSTRTPPTTGSNSGTSPQDATLVHKLFEGVLTSETRCLTCETVSSRDESFLDLSIDIEQNSSVTACLKQFSASEMLCQRNKFFCDACCDLQEAEKRMKIKKLPNVLALHLKRFKYQEDVQKYIKLAYRVAFPFELRLFNTVDDTDDADRLYELCSIVVHIGNGPHHGHYISLIKTLGSWLIFDDDAVDSVKESDIPKYFGDSNSGSAYVLYYQAVDIDLVGLGVRPQIPETAEPHPQTAEASPPQPALAHPPGLDSDLSDINDPMVVPRSQTSQPLIKEISPPMTLVTDLELAPPNVTATAAVNNAKESFLRTLRRGPSVKVRSAGTGNTENRASVEGSSCPPTSSGSPVTNSYLVPPPPSTSTLVSSKDKRKEMDRKSNTWFKRKSNKMRSENLAEPSSSTMSPQRGEEGHDFTWFRASGHPPKYRSNQRPLEPSLPDDSPFSWSRPKSAAALPLKPPDDQAHEYESSPGSASSSRSTSLAHAPVELPQQSSSSAPLLGTERRPPPPPPPPGRSPKQKKSASQINGWKSRDRESPVSPGFPARPSTAGATSGSPVTARPIPPVPPLPPLPMSPLLGSREDHTTNGHTLKSDAREHATARGRSRPSGGVDEVPDLRPHTAHGSAAFGLGTFADSNQSTSTSSSASSNIKKPKRKLSLTAPILGFGRKDKDKQKEEKEKSPYHATAYPMANRL